MSQLPEQSGQSAEAGVFEQAKLSLEDARAVDHLLERGRRMGDVAGAGPVVQGVEAASLQGATATDDTLAMDAPVPAVPVRIEGARALGRLLDSWPVPGAPVDLASRTLAKVRQARELSRTRTEPLKFSFSPGRLTEIAAMAAMVLISFSLAIPMLTHARDNQRRLLCQTNLGQMGAALASYAQDNQSYMPRGRVSPNDSWWRVGQKTERGQNVQSNSAHVYMLARQGYIDPNVMACPDNASAPRNMTAQVHDWADAKAVSYSYQNQYTSKPYSMNGTPDMAVLADKNPLFQISRGKGVTYRRDLSPNSATRFHRSNGQNVLTTAGSVAWKTDPLRNHNDNIWLLNHVRDYEGNESPLEQDDSFLVP